MDLYIPIVYPESTPQISRKVLNRGKEKDLVS